MYHTPSAREAHEVWVAAAVDIVECCDLAGEGGVLGVPGWRLVLGFEVGHDLDVLLRISMGTLREVSCERRTTGERGEKDIGKGGITITSDTSRIEWWNRRFQLPN